MRPAHEYEKTITISKFKDINSDADPEKSYLAIIADPVAFMPMLAATKNLWCGSWGWSFKITLFTELCSTLTALKRKENSFNVLVKKVRSACEAKVASAWRFSAVSIGLVLLVQRRDTPPSPSPVLNWPDPFIHLGGERYCEIQLSCPRTQRNVPSQGSSQHLSVCSPARFLLGHCAPL